MNLTVIPSDNLIILDGKPISTAFDAPDNLHALHFDGEIIRQELIENDGLNEKITKNIVIVQPYLEAAKLEIATRKQASVVFEPTQEEQAKQRAVELERELIENDLTSVRFLRAQVSGTATDVDSTRLQELETKAQELRKELADVAQMFEPEADGAVSAPQDVRAELAALVAELDEISN